MRLEKEIKYDGIFWLPESPEHVVSGTLFIKNGGEIELTINNAEFNVYFNFLIKSGNFEIINGKTNNDKLVTLLDCIYIKNKLIVANTALVGCCFSKIEDILFDNFLISFETSRLDTVNNYCNNTSNIFKYKKHHIDSNTEINIAYLSNSEQHAIVELINIKYFEFNFQKKLSADEFKIYISKFINFINFFVNDPISMNCLKYKLNPINTVDIYYKIYPLIETLSNLTWYNQLYNLNIIDDEFQKIYIKWFLIYDKIKIPLNLYFSVFYNMHRVENVEFLILAQCLESYNRITSNKKVFYSKEKFKDFKNAILDSCPEIYKKIIEQRIQGANDINFRARIE